MKNKGFFWHVHHNVLAEDCYGYNERVEYITANKPSDEVPTRLRLLRPVKGKLPKKPSMPQELMRAWEAFFDADKLRSLAYYEYLEAERRLGKSQKYKEVKLKYKKELEALHRQECPNCPWDGKTIFPKKEE